MSSYGVSVRAGEDGCRQIATAVLGSLVSWCMSMTCMIERSSCRSRARSGASARLESRPRKSAGAHSTTMLSAVDALKHAEHVVGVARIQDRRRRRTAPSRPRRAQDDRRPTGWAGPRAASRARSRARPVQLGADLAQAGVGKPLGDALFERGDRLDDVADRASVEAWVLAISGSGRRANRDTVVPVNAVGSRDAINAMLCRDERAPPLDARPDQFGSALDAHAGFDHTDMGSGRARAGAQHKAPCRNHREARAERQSPRSSAVEEKKSRRQRGP